jgi:hypothetical protein
MMPITRRPLSSLRIPLTFFIESFLSFDAPRLRKDAGPGGAKSPDYTEGKSKHANNDCG